MLNYVFKDRIFLIRKSISRRIPRVHGVSWEDGAEKLISRQCIYPRKRAYDAPCLTDTFVAGVYLFSTNTCRRRKERKRRSEWKNETIRCKIYDVRCRVKRKRSGKTVKEGRKDSLRNFSGLDGWKIRRWRGADGPFSWGSKACRGLIFKRVSEKR